MSSIDHYLALLADSSRLDAYRRAIRRTVRPGDVVVDIGAGPGTLAILAAQAGAGRVYAVEEGPIGKLTLELARANGVADRIEPLSGRSTALDVPERADVGLFDDFQVIELGGETVATLADLRSRWLKPKGRLLPSQVELWVAPINRLPELPGLCPTPSATDSLILKPLIDLGYQTPWQVWLGSTRSLLSEPRRIARAVTDDFASEPIAASGSFVMAKRGRVCALLCWLRLRLTPRIPLDTGPGVPRTAYSQVLLPLPQPFSIKARERLHFSLRYVAPPARRGFHRLWSWKLAGKAGESQGSTFAALAHSAAAEPADKS